MRNWKRAFASAALLAFAFGCATSPGADATAQLDALTERMIAQEIRDNPLLGYFVDVGVVDHRRWPDVGPEALRRSEAEDDALLEALRAIDVDALAVSDRFVVAAIRERLEAGQDMRVCRTEWWAISHMGGWHLQLSTVAREQPVETPEERAQALERWRSLPVRVEQEIANARAGLAAGYSSPQSVVRRVIQQFDALLADTSPLKSPATRSQDAEFSAAFIAAIDGPVTEALRSYRDFLANEYVARAREERAISVHPNGVACYSAFLRLFTTLQRTPQEVYDLGQRTVAANAARVRELGAEALGTDDLALIVPRVAEASDNRFASEEELIAFSRAIVPRARDASARFFLTMPRQPVVVEPFELFRRNAGGSSYYERQADNTRPATYRIQSLYWQQETRGGAEITAVHETFPGHHMQIALASVAPARPITRMLGNSAYIEGWARYAEALAEEAGIYQTQYALITRRLWPARGMVVDPGFHVMGWTPEQVIAFIRESGRFPGEDAAALVDRIAIMPGQLTAYDSGGLEIIALRRQAEEALGARFDAREFHQRILEHGAVPLTAMRAHVEAWIATERR